MRLEAFKDLLIGHIFCIFVFIFDLYAIVVPLQCQVL